MLVKRRNGQHEVTIGARIVIGPGAVALLVVVAAKPPENAPVSLRIHHASEDEFGLIPIVGRLGKIVVAFLADVFAKRFLEGVQTARQSDRQSRSHEPFANQPFSSQVQTNIQARHSSRRATAHAARELVM